MNTFPIQNLIPKHWNFQSIPRFFNQHWIKFNLQYSKKEWLNVLIRLRAKKNTGCFDPNAHKKKHLWTYLTLAHLKKKTTICPKNNFTIFLESAFILGKRWPLVSLVILKVCQISVVKPGHCTSSSSISIAFSANYLQVQCCFLLLGFKAAWISSI